MHIYDTQGVQRNPATRLHVILGSGLALDSLEWRGREKLYGRDVGLPRDNLIKKQSEA